MATPRGARHTDLEQRLRDLEDTVRRLSYMVNFQRQLTVTSGDLIVSEGGSVVIEDGGTVIVGGEPVEHTLFENTDSLTVAGPGTALIGLEYLPISGSIHVRWRGLDVPPTLWSETNGIVSVTDPSSVLKAGDKLTVAYAHRGVINTLTAGGIILVPYQATGWKWSGTLSRTDNTDYSSPSFDDSAWETAQAAFGNLDASILDWPSPHKFWPATQRMWARRTFTATAGLPLTIRARIEYEVGFYLNGVLVGAAAPHATEMAPITVPGTSVLSSNTLAVVITDNNVTGGDCYFDMEVTQ